ncbi:ferritin-like domain-containing protein [Clostridium arbusti]|uniref:ferritin-like domain-containing protein n=1 Tax=Clostridium arbusti TaxID=1137848 RepID=UPI0002897042|nr:ferritin family protein [Clostridium arbusti]
MGFENSSYFRVNLPYPSFKICKKDKHDAAILLDDYASCCVSEYTTISQYIYAQMTTSDKCVSKTFLQIAIVEMSHLDMLGRIICDLGVKPKFRSGDCKIWCSDCVPYGHCTKDRIKLAIKGEYKAIEQYERHIEKLHNKCIKELLARIILDEKLHIKIFKDLLCR